MFAGILSLPSHARDSPRFVAPALTSVVLLLSLTSGKDTLAAGLLGGTVVAIDLEAKEVVLQMPEGHTTAFSIAQAELLKDVKVGDRVSIELDQNGKIVKLVKLPVDPGN
jgi:hypothetical protein